MPRQGITVPAEWAEDGNFEMAKAKQAEVTTKLLFGWFGKQQPQVKAGKEQLEDSALPSQNFKHQTKEHYCYATVTLKTFKKKQTKHIPRTEVI